MDVVSMRRQIARLVEIFNSRVMVGHTVAESYPPPVIRCCINIETARYLSYSICIIGHNFLHFVTGSSSQISVQATTLNVNQAPVHAHTVYVPVSGASGPGYGRDGGTNAVTTGVTLTTSNTGASQAHTHGVADNGHTHTATAAAVATVPPYYKLVFCVKLPAA